VSGTVPSGKDPHGRCDARNLSEDLGLVEDVPKSPTAEHRDPKTTKPYDRCGYNPERGADSSRCDLLENRYWAPLMARNASIYISSDAVARSTVYRGDPALPFSPRLEERFSVPIIYGAGDDTLHVDWNPLNYGLVIFIISSDQTRSPNWYRLQFELQRIRQAIPKESAPSTLMFVHSSRIFLAKRSDIFDNTFMSDDLNIPVLRNILNYGSWIEYQTDSELDSLLGNEIGFFVDNLSYPLERTDGSWRITLARTGQSKVGAKWIEDRDSFRLDTSITDTDERVARDRITAQIHVDIKNKAKEFLPIAHRLSNSVGWEGIGQAAKRYYEAINTETEELPKTLGFAYDAMLELGSFAEQDTELQQEPSSSASPLDPEIRRPLRLLIRVAAPWLRRFPTIRELDDECGAFLRRPELIEPAASVLAIARRKRLVSAGDADATQGVLDAARRGKFQGEKAGTRGSHTVRNLVVASAAAVATFFSGAVASDYSTKSALIKHAGSTLAEAEELVTTLMSDMPDDIKIALREVIKQLKISPVE
jgi:hypothetical protein